MYKKFILATILTSFSFSNEYSLSFDGVDDFVEFPDIDLLNNYTLSITYKSLDELDRISEVILNGS